MQQQSFDLVLKGGRVIDPAQGIDGTHDVGIAELEEYIAGLESEIARARAEIAAKQRQRSGAEALFKR